MTTETRLRDAMARAVAPELPDTDHLVTVARRRGLGIRRRRQALAAVGVAAAVGLAVVAPTVTPGDRAPATDRTIVGTQPRTFGDGPRDAITGRSTAAALLYAIGLRVDGTATDIRGAGSSDGYPSTYAVLRFTPEGSHAAGEVAVNADSGFTRGETKQAAGRAQLGRCEDFMDRCVSTRLPDGSRLTTYDDLSSRSDGIRRVVELYRPDVDFRLVVSASNGIDVTERDEQIARADPVLTTEDLVAIATQPWWGATLPRYFTAQGAGLGDYSDRSSSTP